MPIPALVLYFLEEFRTRRCMYFCHGSRSAALRYALDFSPALLLATRNVRDTSAAALVVLPVVVFISFTGHCILMLIHLLVFYCRSMMSTGVRARTQGGMAAKGRKLRQVHRAARTPCQGHPLRWCRRLGVEKPDGSDLPFVAVSCGSGVLKMLCPPLFFLLIPFEYW